MTKHIVKLGLLAGGVNAFELRFTAPDPAQARQAQREVASGVKSLAEEFMNAFCDADFESKLEEFRGAHNLKTLEEYKEKLQGCPESCWDKQYVDEMLRSSEAVIEERRQYGAQKPEGEGKTASDLELKVFKMESKTLRNLVFQRIFVGRAPAEAQEAQEAKRATATEEAAAPAAARSDHCDPTAAGAATPAAAAAHNPAAPSASPAAGGDGAAAVPGPLTPPGSPPLLPVEAAAAPAAPAQPVKGEEIDADAEAYARQMRNKENQGY